MKLVVNYLFLPMSICINLVATHEVKNSAYEAHQAIYQTSSSEHEDKLCAKCQNVIFKLRKCSACLEAVYCSRECQIADWPQHRGICQNDERKIAKAKSLLFLADKTPAKKIFELVLKNSQDKEVKGRCHYHLASLEIPQKHTFNPSDHPKIAHHLIEAVRLGNKSAEAMMELFLLDDEVAPEQQQRLEEYIEDPELGWIIRGHLAYNVYINTDKKLASKIFDELAAEKNLTMASVGTIGNVKYLKKYCKNRSMMRMALDLALIPYKIHPNKSFIKAGLRYDLALALTEFDKNHYQEEIDGILHRLVEEKYRPAIYYLEEQEKASLHKKKKKKKKTKPKTDETLFMPENNEPSLKECPLDDVLSKKVGSSDSPSLSIKAPPKIKMVEALTPIRPENEFVATLLNRDNIILRPEAIQDINKLIRKNRGSLELTPERIIHIVDSICEQKGRCNEALAKKIRGLDHYWRSWIGRDYRMDWIYVPNATEMKIEIRHIGLKKNFTYGP